MNHPNAIYGGLFGGAGGGAFVSWLLNDVLHWHVNPTSAAAIAGGCAAVVLYIGRRGILGALRDLLHGAAKPPNSVPPTPPVPPVA